MALTTYTAATDIIKTLGTNPEDRPTLTDDTFKAKFDENSANIAAFLNAMITELASVSAAKGASCIGLQDSAGRFTATQVEAALAEIAGSGRTTETVKGLADLISTHTGETVYELKTATRDGQTAGVQTISGLVGTPKRIEIRANVASTFTFSVGSWEQSGGQSCIDQYGTNLIIAVANYAVVQFQDGANGLNGAIQNVTNGSFEINWTKLGTGRAGTITMQIICHYH